MKNFFRVLGTQSLRFCTIALVAVIVFSMAACSNNTGDPVEPDPDDRPNLNIPLNPSEIPNFDTASPTSAYAGYDAYTAEDLDYLEELLEELFSDPESFIPEIPGLSISQSNAGRAVQRESIYYKLSQQEGAPPGLFGFVNMAYSYDDADENGFPVTASGSAQFRLDIADPLQNDAFDVLGFVSGSARINGVEISFDESAEELVMKGSVSATINIAINIADNENQKWIKFIGGISVSANLETDEITCEISCKAYGDGATAIAEYTETLNIPDFFGDEEG